VQHTLAREQAQLELEGHLAAQQLRRLEQSIAEEGWVSQAAARQQQVLQAKIARITLAQRRVRAGTYGLCSGCGQAIAAERLEAVPDTTLCVACKDEAVRSGIRTGRNGNTSRNHQGH
jgi:DnaK suppressor protein